MAHRLFALGLLLLLTAPLEAVQDEASDDDEHLQTQGSSAIDIWDDILKGLRTPIPIERAPSTTSVILGEDLRSSGARFLSDGLRLVPGIEVLRTTSTDSNVSARSYSDVASTAQGMQALVDGRVAYNDFFGNVLWDALPVSLHGIDRVEVVRGPGSFLYGPNAMHGLVNIFTKSPLDYEGDFLDVSAAYGSYESTMANATYVRRDEEARAGFKVTLGWDSVARFEPKDQGSSDKGFAEFQFESLLGESEGDARFMLTGGIVEQKPDILIPTFLGVPPAELATDLQENFLKANLAAGDLTRDEGELKAQVVWTGFESTSLPDRFYTPFRLDLDTLDIDVQYALPRSGGHALTAGAGYRYATFETKDQDVSDGRHDTDLAWVFVQDELALLENTVFLTAGVRVDWHTVSGTNVSPRLAAVWNFAENHHARASAGFGFRNPSLRESWFEMPVTLPGLPGPATILGNDDLDAERIRSFELGYFGEPWEGVRARANLFYNLIDDLIVFRPTGFFASGAPSTIAPFNQNDEEAYGAELDLNYELAEGITAFGNYSYQVRRNRDTDDRVLTAPKHKANLGLRYTSGGLTAAVWANYFDRTEFEDVRLDEYVLLNGSLAYEFDAGHGSRGRVFVQGFNLVDDHREHPDGQAYDPIVMAGVGFSF